MKTHRARTHWEVLLMAGTAMAAAGAALGAAGPPENLRCEYLTNPLGIDTPQP